MRVEFFRGPRDGEVMEVPDGTRYVDLPVENEHLTQVKAWGEVVSLQTVRCYFGRRRDGSIVAVWPTGCS